MFKVFVVVKLLVYLKGIVMILAIGYRIWSFTLNFFPLQSRSCKTIDPLQGNDLCLGN